MTGTIFLIILATSMGIYHDTNKPTEYELSMEDGSNAHLILQRNNKYACPLYCDVDHIHHAVMCKDKEEVDNNRLVYHISEKNESGMSFYCSTKKILTMSRLVPKTSKEKIPNIVSATKDN